MQAKETSTIEKNDININLFPLNSETCISVWLASKKAWEFPMHPACSSPHFWKAFVAVMISLTTPEELSSHAKGSAAAPTLPEK